VGKLTVDRMRREVVSSMLITLGVSVGAAVAIPAQRARAGVPTPGAQAASPAGEPPTTSKKSAPAAPVKLVDINSASRAELKTLPGIGDAEADKIIAGRPYLSKVHIVTEAGLPVGTYQSIRHQIVAVQNKAAKAKFKTLAGAPPAQPR
jgi:DNA uptake protein ComE-like DNA-binding protein